ncbi:MAG: PadR family transcriptional regulator [Chloroflexota bacterium]|nr:PadR family transcriptional regulator [Chloroflexota bacterium]
MYELIILSLLIRWPAHGYLISSIINDMIGPYAKISNGRLYPLLSKLEEQGLIEAYAETERTQKGERHLRSYRITEDGRKRFHDLMLDTTSNPGEYQKLFLQKATVLEFLKPSERLYLIDHYINYCQAHVLHLTAETEDLVRNVNNKAFMSRSQLETTVNVMQHVADQWHLELEWARSLREKEVAQAKAKEFEASNSEP